MKKMLHSLVSDENVPLLIRPYTQKIFFRITSLADFLLLKEQSSSTNLSDKDIAIISRYNGVQEVFLWNYSTWKTRKADSRIEVDLKNLSKFARF